ncbi:MAG TPA: hypothetical protein VKQ29_17025 [Aliidongia sp.]|nr:hypothetical protein [Aliidongia sp.]
MSLADIPSIAQPDLVGSPLRVILDHDRQLADDLLAALHNGRSPVFARWPDPTGAAIIGSARSATGASALAFDCAYGTSDFEPIQIEFEFHLAVQPPIRILAEAWIPV